MPVMLQHSRTTRPTRVAGKRSADAQPASTTSTARHRVGQCRDVQELTGDLAVDGVTAVEEFDFRIFTDAELVVVAADFGGFECNPVVPAGEDVAVRVVGRGVLREPLLRLSRQVAPIRSAATTWNWHGSHGLAARRQTPHPNDSGNRAATKRL